MSLFSSIVPLVKWFTIASLLIPTLLLIFKRKCQRNASNHSTASLLIATRIERLARIHVKFVLFLYLLDIIKNLLLIALDLESMRAYRWLDCFVVGRLAFVGRTGKDTKYLGLLVSSYGLIYRSLLIYLEPPFNFQAVEFILNGQAVALEKEIASLEFDKPTKKIYASDMRSCWYQSISGPPRQRATRLIESRDDHLDLCYFVPDYFEDSQTAAAAEAALNLRPNRSLESWKVLNIFAFAFGTFLVVYGTVLAFWLLITIGPQLVTNLGFKLNYALCYSWLIDQKRQFNRTYGEIYLVSDHETRTASGFNLRERAPSSNLRNITQVVSIFLPLAGDLIPLTSYNKLRIVYDFIQNNLLYFDFFTTMAMHTQNIFLIMFDVYANYKLIERRLLEVRHLLILRKEHEKCHLNEPELERQLYATTTNLELLMNFLFNLSERHKTRQAARTTPLNQQLVSLQSILVDHFIMIHRYNKYIEFHFLACMTMWLVYTSSLCAWMSYAGFERVSLEFYISFLVSLILVIVLLCGPAFLRASNCKLYALISSTMALDTNLDTKSRWISILNYYFPAPLFCFSFFRAYQLSWFFCLKLYSWVITALLVVASFMLASKKRT